MNIQSINNYKYSFNDFHPILRELETAKRIFLELIFSGKDSYKARKLLKDAEREYKEGKTNLASNLVKEALNEINIDLEDIFLAIKEMTEAAGQLSGLPIKQIYQTYEGAKDILKGDLAEGALKLLGWSPYQVEERLD